jgi:ABC-type transport system substrate-binding protein
MVALSLFAACREAGPETAVTPVAPTPTSVQEPTATPDRTSENFVTIATDAPVPPFASFDDFGTVVGFDAELAEYILSRTDYEYEFVVTNFSGMLESVADGEFDMAISALTAEEPVPGVSYSEPYLDVGQVLVVLANEKNLISYRDVTHDNVIGIVENVPASERTAFDIVGVPETNLQYYPSVGQALQALIAGAVDGVILDNSNAEHYTRTHFEQLKIAGGNGRDAWIDHQTYVVAVNDQRPDLLDAANQAIAAAREDGTLERITRNWLVSKETINAGESLIGTPNDIIVIGMLGSVDSVDPAAAPDAIGWELKYNTMSGLYMFDADNSLVPVLADGPPTLSENKLEVTVHVREGLAFPDGSPLSAEDVRWSVSRAASFGNWHVNAFLKDADGDFIADADAVQVVDPLTIKFTLQQPTSFFANLLATPPYFPISQTCYASNADPARTCNAIGAYEIIEWREDLVQLQANPQWIGPDTPAFDNIQIRFYNDPGRLQNAVELGAVDVAWGDLPPQVITALLAADDFRAWEGPAIFKSYLVFQHLETPWRSPAVRQAIAYAVDREALAQQIFQGRRLPLYSPLPNSVPEQVNTEPQRDLDAARDRLQLAGYSTANPLVIPLWYLNDGRYTTLEEAYAQAIKEQLEETGMIQVELNSAAWNVYGAQMSDCNYATFLLGWPPVGWPTRYPAPMGWLDYFVTNTDSLCSNYQGAEMDLLVRQLRELDPADTAGREDLYTRIQELWAQELPTLDLTQSGPQLVAANTINNVTFDLMGLVHYARLTKAGD